MFLLSGLSGDGNTYGLRQGESYIVGRENGSILLSDSSVSRKHAIITVKQSEVTITDLKSANGTLINSVILTPNKEHRVSFGSNIQFGMNAKFCLEKADLMVTCSALSSDQKRVFAELTKKQGVKIVSEWNPSLTHVVSSGSAVTKKILCAIIKGQPLVQIDFFQERWKCIQNSKPLPREADFSMRKLESQCPVEINYKCKRTTLFAEKIFIFSTPDDKSKLGDIVEMCGGRPVTVNDKVFSAQDFRGDIQHLLVSSDAESTRQLQKLVDLINRLGQRVIPAQEISAAVIAGNTQYFCNSRCKIVQRITSEVKEIQRGKVLVEETQSCREDTEMPIVSSSISLSETGSLDEASVGNMVIDSSEFQNNTTSAARGIKRLNDSDTTSATTSASDTVLPKSKKLQLKRSKQPSGNENITSSFAQIGLNDKQADIFTSFVPKPKVSLVEVNTQKTESPRLRLKRNTNDATLKQAENSFQITPKEVTTANATFATPKENAPPFKRKLTLKRKKEHSPQEEVAQKRLQVFENSVISKNVFNGPDCSTSTTTLASSKVNSLQGSNSNISVVSVANTTNNRKKTFSKFNFTGETDYCPRSTRKNQTGWLNTRRLK